MRYLVLNCLAFCFLFTATLSFANESNIILPAKDEGKNCNEPAPANYQVAEVFTNGVIVDWDDPVNMPAEYNVKVFEVTSGNLVHNANIAGAFSIARVGNLQPNTAYSIRTTPVCSDGTLSDEFSEAEFLTLILDLVVSGFTAQAPPATCTISANNQGCTINPPVGNTVTFQVSTNAGSRVFGFHRSNNECGSGASYQVKYRPTRYNDDQSFEFFCNSSTTANCSGSTITIRRLGSVVAILNIGQAAGSGTNVYATYVNTNLGAQIARLGSSSGSYDPEGSGCIQRSSSPNADYLGLEVNPNPFNQLLNIQIPFANNQETEIALFDLQGRRILTQRWPAEQANITLDTENLTPGMYFLRAESGGISQTVKVVKTQ